MTFGDKYPETVHVVCNSFKKIEWLEFPGKLSLENNTPSVFAIRISDFINQLPEVLRLLDEDELLKSRKYFHREDEQRFIITRGILKILIGQYLNKSPAEIKIKPGLNKKPEISGDCNITCNLSHSGDWAVIVIDKWSVGIDIEKMIADFNFQEILKVSFSESESLFIKNSDSPLFQFYLLWTRKEALSKGTAKGIDDDFHSIPSMDGSHLADMTIIGSNTNWTISSLVIDHHVISIASMSDNYSSIKFYQVPGKLLGH